VLKTLKSSKICKILPFLLKYMNWYIFFCKYLAGNSGNSKTGKQISTKSKKSTALSNKIALMKIKSSAKGDAGVPVESRVYFSILLPSNGPSSASSKCSNMWFDQV